MAVWKVHHEKNYTVITNDILRDTRISLKAIGLLTIIMSLPPDWNFSERGLEAICKDGLTSVKNALQELEEFGYLIRTQTRNSDGSYSTSHYDFYEVPRTENPISENAITENMISENAITENEHNKVKNNKIKNDIIKNNIQDNIEDKSSIPTLSVNELEDFLIVNNSNTYYKPKGKSNVNKDISPNTKTYQNLVDFIINLRYNKTTIDNLLLWYKNVGVGKVTLKHLQDKLQRLENEGYSEEQMSDIIYNAYIDNSIIFTRPNKYNSSSKTKPIKAPSQITDDDVMKNPDGSVLVYKIL